MSDDKEFKLCLIVVWFGRWPEWIDLFFRSCAANKNIDFLVFTDCELRDSMVSNNIRVKKIELSAMFVKLTCAAQIGEVHHTKAYKLCDFMPLFGLAFKDYLNRYSHWGVCDSDLVFGDIEKFIDKSADLFSTHSGFISGHFFYVRNSSFYNHSFKLIRGWRRALITDSHFGLNEGSWSNIFIPKSLKAKLMSKIMYVIGIRPKVVDVELFTTPHAGIPWADGTFEYPDYWLYRDMALNAIKDGVAREVPYLHFMNWKIGSKYLPKCYEKPLWQGVDLSSCESIWQNEKIRISGSGFSLD